MIIVANNGCLLTQSEEVSIKERRFERRSGRRSERRSGRRSERRSERESHRNCTADENQRLPYRRNHAPHRLVGRRDNPATIIDNQLTTP